MNLTKKQKAVLDYITSYTQQHDVAPTQREIRDHFGLKSFGSVQRYLKYLCESGHIAQDWNARRGLKLLSSSPDTTPEAQESSKLEVPLLGDVAAGDPIEALENTRDTISIPAQMLPKGSTHQFFALQVHGNSMIEDGILPDDLIVCQQQGHANQGERVVAVINGEATVKKFYKSGQSIELHPANSRLSPYIYNPEEMSEDDQFHIAGKVVGLLRYY